jgi:hypothetical protein
MYVCVCVYIYIKAGIGESVQQWATGWMARVRFLAGARVFSTPPLLHSVKTICGANAEHEQRWRGDGDVAQTQVQRIFNHDGFYPYCLQEVQHLLPGDHTNHL